MASITQSVGVPSICQAPSGRRAGRSGRCSVSEWEVPLCSRSGATTVTAADLAADVGEQGQSRSENAVVIGDENVHPRVPSVRPSRIFTTSSIAARTSAASSASNALRAD